MATDAGNRNEREPQQKHQQEHQQERQQRELEEIRRSFTEVGVRMGSLFEPAQHSNHRDDSDGPLALPIPMPRPVKGRPAWGPALAVVVACLLTGGGLGYLLHRPPTPTSTVQPTPPSIITQPTQATQPPPAPAPQPRVVAPPACLQTAQRGDELIDLFTRNVRDNRLSVALKAYTLASQACRKEASP